jgi:hypothetical protein
VALFAFQVRDLESARVAPECLSPERAGEPLWLMVNVAGDKSLWFRPFVLQPAP